MSNKKAPGTQPKAGTKPALKPTPTSIAKDELLKPNEGQVMEESSKDKITRKQAAKRKQAAEQSWKRLEVYVATMLPNKPKTPVQAQQQQYLLNGIFENLFCLEVIPQEEAVANLEKIRDIIADNSGVDGAFSERLYMRDIEDTNLSKEQKGQFTALLYTLREIAVNRKEMVIDWEMFTRKLNPVYGELVMERFRTAFNFG